MESRRRNRRRYDRSFPQRKRVRSRYPERNRPPSRYKNRKLPAELRKCLRQSREFSAAVESSLREYRDSIDNAVEDALFRRAVGFEQPDGKFSPPDVRAAMFWLKNRRPEAWSEKDRDGAGRTVPALSDLEEEL